MDKKKNKTIAYIISGILLLLVAIGVSYAYFRARIIGNESSQSIAGTAAYLELTFTDGTPAINADGIVPGWSASKTFTVENTGEGKAYYVLKVTDIINSFSLPGSISFKIESTDGGANVSKMDLPSSSQDISSATSINAGVTHHYTITTYYNNLDVDQTPDLGANFTYTITIGAVRDDVPEYWRNAEEGSLIAAIKKNYPDAGGLWTMPGADTSKKGNITAITVSDAQAEYTWTYGDGYTINEWFSLTNPSTCTYSSCYTSLLGKYLVSNTVANNSDSGGAQKTTTGITNIYKVIYASPTLLKVERYDRLAVYGTSSTYKYWTYGTGAESAGISKYNLTGVNKIIYDEEYEELEGKYIYGSSNTDTSVSNIAASAEATTKTTTNISYFHEVVDAEPTYIVYKSAVESDLGKTEDDYGTSYYFRGAVENNYVVFANMCWRIVRTDGNGNTKLVLYNYNSGGVSNPCDSQYDATDAAFARYSGSTFSTKFNSSTNNNAYVGFTYGTPGSSTYEAEHTKATPTISTILTNLMTWYDAKFSAAQKAQLADVIWCNDKSLNTDSEFTPAGATLGYTNLGYNKEKTYYGATTRLLADKSTSWKTATTSKVTLVCPDAGSDGKLSKYTASDTTNGNGYLTINGNEYKIGLLTVDEIAFAGSVYTYGYSNDNSAYYLNRNSSNLYCSLSPINFSGNYVAMWYAAPNGSLANYGVTSNAAIRPAISLIPNVKVTGSGKQSDPFVVQN